MAKSDMRIKFEPASGRYQLLGFLYENALYSAFDTRKNMRDSPKYGTHSSTLSNPESSVVTA